MMVSFVLSFFPRDVLDEILNLIESVSEDFPSYSYISRCQCGIFHTQLNRVYYFHVFCVFLASKNLSIQNARQVYNIFILNYFLLLSQVPVFVGNKNAVVEVQDPCAAVTTPIDVIEVSLNKTGNCISWNCTANCSNDNKTFWLDAGILWC